MTCRPGWAGSGTAGFVDGTHDVAQFSDPFGLALSPDRLTLYVADYGNNAIRQIDVETRVTSTLATGITNPDHLACNPVTGDLYTWDGVGTGKQIAKVTPAGAVSHPFAAAGTGQGYREGHGIAVSPDGLYVYVTYSTDFFGADGRGVIQKNRVSDGSRVWHTIYAGLFCDPSCCAASPDGLYVYGSTSDFSGRIIRFRASDGALLDDPYGGGIGDGLTSVDTFENRIAVTWTIPPGPAGGFSPSVLQVWREDGSFFVQPRTRIFGNVGVVVWRDRSSLYVTDAGLGPTRFSGSAGYTNRGGSCHVIRIVRLTGWEVGKVRIA